MTGATKDRPHLTQMLEYVRDGDTVVVHSSNRLARNFDDLLQIIKILTAKGVIFKSLHENITIGEKGKRLIENLILHIFGAIAEFNRSLIKEAQKGGVTKAKAGGVCKGRKIVLTPAVTQHLIYWLLKRINRWKPINACLARRLQTL